MPCFMDLLRVVTDLRRDFETGARFAEARAGLDFQWRRDGRFFTPPAYLNLQLSRVNLVFPPRNDS
ncbi:MAG: hypothetical protein JWR69_4631 [Pedosphaera sp.]|nr:hypothetical protein [Pedosphaera sp.]